MKTTRLTFSMILLFMFLFIVRCNNNDPAPLVKLTGKVTFIDANGATANAKGAIVYLAKSDVATTTYDQNTVADANGDFTFSNLAAGKYYLNASYYSDNKNINGRLDGLNFNAGDGVFVNVTSVPATQDIALVSGGQANAQAVQVSYQWDPTANANVGGYTNTGAWLFDNVHSPVQFVFPYRAFDGDFQGSFGLTHKFLLNFDPANLATSTIEAEIDLLSVSTRTPGGRDADVMPNKPNMVFSALGCIAGTFGITADAGTVTPTITVNSDVDRYAKFKSTSIAKYGDGFVATGDLTFHGITKSINMIFKYIPSFIDGTKTYQGFEGKFVMDAKNDFSITTASVGVAMVNIYISVTLYKIN